jgi:hypothetical protein
LIPPFNGVKRPQGSLSCNALAAFGNIGDGDMRLLEITILDYSHSDAVSIDSIPSASFISFRISGIHEAFGAGNRPQ